MPKMEMNTGRDINLGSQWGEATCTQEAQSFSFGGGGEGVGCGCMAFFWNLVFPMCSQHHHTLFHIFCPQLSSTYISSSQEGIIYIYFGSDQSLITLFCDGPITDAYSQKKFKMTQIWCSQDVIEFLLEDTCCSSAPAAGTTSFFTF
jgi:hypothetical protein